MPNGQMEITFKGTLLEVMQQVWEFAWSVGIIGITEKSELDPNEELARTAGLKRSHKDLMSDFERGLIIREMDNCDNNISKTARALSLSRYGLTMKLKRYGLERLVCKEQL